MDKPVSPSTKNVLIGAMLIVITGWGVWYLLNHANLSVIRSRPVSFWLLQCVILGLYLFLGTLLTNITLRNMGATCSLGTLFLVLQASYSTSYLGPLKLGIPLRIYLFKKLMGTSYATSTSATLFVQFIRVGMIFLLSVLGITIWFFEFSRELMLAVAVFSLAIICAVVFLRLLREVETHTALLTRLRLFILRVADAINMLRLTTIALLLMLSFMMMLLISCSTFFIIKGFGYHIPFINVVFIDAIAILVGLLTFVPMGIGTRDATTFFLLMKMGLSEEVIYSVILIQRMIWSLLPFLAGLVSANLLGAANFRGENRHDHALDGLNE